MSDFDSLIKSINTHTDELQGIAEALLAVVQLHGLTREITLPDGSYGLMCAACDTAYEIPCSTIKTIIKVLGL